MFVQIGDTQQYSLFAVSVRDRPGEPKPLLADAGFSCGREAPEALSTSAFPMSAARGAGLCGAGGVVVASAGVAGWGEVAGLGGVEG